MYDVHRRGGVSESEIDIQGKVKALCVALWPCVPKRFLIDGQGSIAADGITVSVLTLGKLSIRID